MAWASHSSLATEVGRTRLGTPKPWRCKFTAALVMQWGEYLYSHTQWDVQLWWQILALACDQLWQGVRCKRHGRPSEHESLVVSTTLCIMVGRYSPDLHPVWCKLSFIQQATETAEQSMHISYSVPQLLSKACMSVCTWQKSKPVIQIQRLCMLGLQLS